MANEQLVSISSATGSFRQLSAPAEGAGVSKIGNEMTGKEGPTPGKNMPVVAEPRPDMKELARKLNVASQSIGRDLRFEVNLESGRSVIQVLDSETGEMIRQIPPEKADVYLSDTGEFELRLYDAQV